MDGRDVEAEVLAARRNGATKRECGRIAGYSARVIDRILSRNPAIEEEYNRCLSRKCKARLADPSRP